MDVAPEYSENMLCWDVGTYATKKDGNDVKCFFRGYRKAVTLFTINENGLTTPLTGQDVVKETEKVVAFSEDLWIDPLPYDYLFTAHTKPQVKVTVKGVPGVCNGNCNYAYEDLTSSVDTAALSGGIMTVDGNSLPTTDDTEVWMGRRNCTITAKTAN